MFTTDTKPDVQTNRLDRSRNSRRKDTTSQLNDSFLARLAELFT